MIELIEAIIVAISSCNDISMKEKEKLFEMLQKLKD